jgi:polyhydroxyalkanoate synthesis regulator phasin
VVSRDDVQKYLDAGIAFTNLTRTRAEELVGELVNSGVFQSGDARAKLDELIERSRKGSEQLVTQVRAEVANQLGAMGITSLEDLAREVAAMIGRSADAGKAATTKSAVTKKSAAKKTAPRKAAATKTAPKRTATKKAAAKKTAPSTSTAETAPSTRGVAADSRAPEPGESG